MTEVAETECFDESGGKAVCKYSISIYTRTGARIGSTVPNDVFFALPQMRAVCSESR